MSNITLDNYKKVQQDISQIRERLDDTEEKKEHWFTKKEDLKKDIQILINQVKEIKAEQDKKNIQLQDLKKQRDKYNDEVKQLIKKIKNINEEKAEAFKKYNVKVEPSKIQQKINELEKKVEIEINFEKEKKLMEEIKKLKKVYEESSEIIKIAEKAHSLEKEIRESRKKADEFHKKIQEITKDTGYDVFIELSKRITELKSTQEDAFQKFIDYKNKYAEASRELKNRLDETKLLEMVLSKSKEVLKIKQEEKQKQFIKEKSKLVEEKIKAKKKLTTEDLITMQGTSDIYP